LSPVVAREPPHLPTWVNSSHETCVTAPTQVAGTPSTHCRGVRATRRVSRDRTASRDNSTVASRTVGTGWSDRTTLADTPDMSGCCDPRGCNDIFGPRFARHLTSRYRKRGLDKTAARMAEFIVDHGITDATILEIGGGIGDIQLELLGRGARHATNLELVDAYDTAANDLARAAGMSDRVTRRQVDIAATPDAVPPADIVILHRVVCCYPDYERLLTSAADHARRLLVFSHPPRNPVSRALMAAQNLTFRLLGKSFRTYTHPPAAMVAVAERSGMRTRYTYHGPVWQVVGLSRATPRSP
jgi:16S rRNA G966 N2-methylase RsmD